MSFDRFKIPFAYTQEGEIVDPSTAEKGKDYKCQCGALVRLRGGDKVSDHFFHLTETDCTNEGIMHKAYKAVFSRCMTIRLPHSVNGVSDLVFDRVELEKKIGDFQPDAIGYIGDNKYLIEFAHTSFIDNKKLDKIKKSNLFCIEVSIMGSANSIDKIFNHIARGNEFKKVIHVPRSIQVDELIEKFSSLKEQFEWRSAEMAKDYEAKIQVMRESMDSEIRRVQLAHGKLDDRYDRFIRAANRYNGRLYLDFVTICKNGAKMYKNDSTGITAFEKDGQMTIVFNLET